MTSSPYHGLRALGAITIMLRVRVITDVYSTNVLCHTVNNNEHIKLSIHESKNYASKSLQKLRSKI